jgi:8-oxo-dGTP pyrophosphatase MutT (NUDIX family)
MVIGAIDRIAILSHWPEALIDVSWVSTFLIGPDRPIVAVGAVAVKDGRALLIKGGEEPGRGLWTLPGGAVHPGEDLKAAVRRELREECGIEVAVEEIADLSHYRMTRGSADQIRRLLARQEDGLQCHGG